MNKWLKVANVLVALAFLWLFFSLVNLGDLAKALESVNWLWLVAAALLYFAMNLTSVWRIRWLLQNKVSFAEAFQSHFAALLLSDVTPGRAGYAYLLVKLKKARVNSSFAAKVLGVGLISDFVVRALLILAAVYLFSNEFLFSGVLIAVGCIAAFGLLEKRVVLFSKLLARVPFYGARLKRVYDGLFDYELSKRALAGSFAVSVAGVIIRGAAWLAVFYALGITANANLFDFVVLNGLLTAISFAPVSIAGIGLQEGAGAVLFSIVLGVSLPTAAALMILIRVVEAGTDFVFGVRPLLLSR
ncbi:MAG: lysylphosphatidylglycerol synthase transmembrane domain-containing protein [Candidatus Micrarchaeota archaeon]